MTGCVKKVLTIAIKEKTEQAPLSHPVISTNPVISTEVFVSQQSEETTYGVERSQSTREKTHSFPQPIISTRVFFIKRSE
jgi:hypothetical protein